jgi:hypothetical protein
VTRKDKNRRGERGVKSARTVLFIITSRKPKPSSEITKNVEKFEFSAIFLIFPLISTLYLCIFLFKSSKMRFLKCFKFFLFATKKIVIFEK